MSPHRFRALAGLLVAAIAWQQLVAGSPTVASLSLALHGGSHSHLVALIQQHGHLDLVLSHADTEEHHHPADGDHHHPAGSSSHDDHVFHIASADAAGGSRSGHELESLVALSAAPAPLFPVVRTVSQAPPEPRSRSADLLRSVVLLL